MNNWETPSAKNEQLAEKVGEVSSLPFLTEMAFSCIH